VKKSAQQKVFSGRGSVVVDRRRVIERLGGGINCYLCLSKRNTSLNSTTQSISNTTLAVFEVYGIVGHSQSSHTTQNGPYEGTTMTFKLQEVGLR
jgi:hypothetical protein